MSKAEKIGRALMLPFELWYEIWSFPDDYYRGQEHDLISTVCYIALKVIWIFVSILIAFLTICLFLGI